MNAISRKAQLFLGKQNHRRLIVISKIVMSLLLAFAVVRLVPVDGPVIEMQLRASQAGVAQWFFDSGHGYSEVGSRSAVLKKGDNVVKFSLPVGEYRHLRFDPIASDSEVTILSVAIKPRIQVTSGDLDLSDFFRLSGVSQLNRTSEGLEVVPDRGSRDPQLRVELAQPLVVRGPLRSMGDDVMAALALAVLVWLLLDVLLIRMSVRQIAVLGLGCAFVLIVTMSAISQTSIHVHPDEPLHISCFEYYLGHFWPPAVGASSTIASLRSSPFGTSYLNQYDVVYFLAAHIMSAVAFLFHSSLEMARTFQHLAWLVLIAMALRSRSWGVALCAALISPQIWYVFSYFNGDAFPLSLSMVAAALAGDRVGGVQRFVRGEDDRPNAAVFVLALCLGLLVVSKSNFLPVILGVFLWLAVQYLGVYWRELVALFGGVALLGMAVFAGKIHGVAVAFVPVLLAILGVIFWLATAASLMLRYWRVKDMRPAVHRLACLVGLTMIFAAPRLLNDLYINGSPHAKSVAITATKEAYAQAAFKPSVVATGHGFSGLDLVGQGVDLNKMLFNPMHWFLISVRSSFGTYGYMDIWAPNFFYTLAWMLSLGLVVYIMFGLVGARRGVGLKLVFVVLSISGLILMSSILFSWVVGFQPQGRYLLPIVPMICLLFGSAESVMRRPVVKLLLVILFALSTYSFVYVGIRGIVLQIYG